MTEKKREDGRLVPSVSNICSSNHKTLPPRKDYTFKDLPPVIQRLTENKSINVIPLKSGSKKPKIRWKSYQQRQYPLKALLEHKGNFGVITGSNGGSWTNLVILDIDDQKGPEGLFRHFKDLDTMQVKTASKGYHLYFWSNQPVEDHNYIGRLFGLDLELRGKREIYCVIPPSSINYEDGYTGGHELLKMGSEYPILELEDVEAYIEAILIKAGYDEQQQIEKANTANKDDPKKAVIVREGVWEHILSSSDEIQLVEHLRTFYLEGQRQKLVLYLSGWMYKAEVSPVSALNVINRLTKKDPEQGQRILALKNSYRRLEDKALKGSSGVWEIIKSHFTKIYKIIKDKDEREEKISTETRNHMSKIAKLIVHPQSIVGIENILKKEKKYSDDALRELIRFIKKRFHPIVDRFTEELYIYDHETGYYKSYSDKEFKEWIDNLFPAYEYFMRDIKKVKDSISNLKDENKDYIWMENGLINTQTLEIEEHRIEVFTKKMVHYSYNPTLTSTFMEKILRDILIDDGGPNEGDDSKYLFFLQWLGYCFLQGNPFHMMLFVTGGGGNGKSILSSIIYHIFGDLVASVPLHDFYAEFSKMGLIGKSINVVYDLPKRMLKDTGELKAITGEDTMTINIKHKPPWTGKLPVKIIGMGNQLPAVNDASTGFWQRIAHFETRNQFRNTNKEDKDLKLKLKKDTEGIEWLIYQSIQAYREGPHQLGREGWAIPIGTDKTKKEYLRLSNPCYYASLELFEKTNDKNDFVEKSDVVRAITDLLRVENLEIPAHNGPFYQAVRNIGGEDSDTSRMDGGNKKTLHGFRMIRFKGEISESNPSEFSYDSKFKLNKHGLDKFGAKSLNLPQRAIINELVAFGSHVYSDMIENIEIETSFQKEELHIELIELISMGIITEEKRE